MNIRWKRALSRLKSSQKLVATALLSILIATAVWWGVRGSRTSMEPVLDQTFADADVVQIVDHLTARGVPHEVHSGRVYVPADQRLDVLSDLIYSDVLSGSTESGFDALVKQTSVWDTPSKTDKLFNRAKEITLEHVVGRFHGVRKATVLIDPTNERHISGSITPSALVDIQTRGNGNPRQLASAAVSAVTGAVSGMTRDQVKVTIDGASYNVGPDQEIDGDLVTTRQQAEQAQVAKVRAILQNIPDVLVSVSVDVDMQSEEDEQSVTTQSPPPQSMPMANAVPLAVDSGPASAPMREIKTSETVQKTHVPAGRETVLSASVAVPRSYFLAIYRRGVRKGSDPDDALLQPVVAAHLAKIKSLVRTALGLKSDSDVTVAMYEDASPVPAKAEPTTARPVTASVAPATPWSFSRHGKEAGYVAAAVAGLVLLMTLMLRRGGSTAPAESMSPSAAGRVRIAPTVARHDAIDAEDDADDDSLGLLRQVRELAAQRPEDATRVLREWILQE